ncbi:MAG TPA: hypothetical protein VFB31_06550 [Pseudolabrys sp.]|nr:hypothetical protein [Pseudolabrys sp.]
MSKLGDFLMRNSAVVGKPLPLIHTCQSYNLEGILSTGRIRTHYCDVFRENLNYFFVGRPAYKKEFGEEAAEWELPTCFIFQYDISDAKRIYPFDTGAFDKKLFPSFIQMMDRDQYELSKLADGPQRLIGTFFGTPASYFRLKTVDEDYFSTNYSLGVFDAEVRALHRLILKTNKKPDATTDYKRIDDRRFTVEVQFDKDRQLQKKDILAAILPEPYFLDPRVTSYFKKLGAKLISYQIHPLNPDLYYGIIYEKIYDFFRRNRYV